MTDWKTLAVRALRDLDGASKMVPGAKLRQQMAFLGDESGFDVAGHVKRSGKQFSDLIAQVEGISIRKRAGSDMLVGLFGAKTPEEPSVQEERREPAEGLRSDVFQAFTRITPLPFSYLPAVDRFVPQDQAKGQSIEVPPSTLDEAIEDRRRFVDTLDTGRRKPFLDALQASTSPLAAFRKVVAEQGAGHQWARALTEAVGTRVRSWASRNGVVPRDDWFRRERKSASLSAHAALARLAPYLTADEIRGLHIPFRAVEALLKDLKR